MFKPKRGVSGSCSVPNSLYVFSQSTLWSNHSMPFPDPCFPAVDKCCSCHAWSPYLSDMFLFKSFLTSPISRLALFPLSFYLVFCPDFAHCIVYHAAVHPELSRANTGPSLSHMCAFVPLFDASAGTGLRRQTSMLCELVSMLFPVNTGRKLAPCGWSGDKLHERTVSCMVMEDLTIPLSVDL